MQLYGNTEINASMIHRNCILKFNDPFNQFNINISYAFHSRSPFSSFFRSLNVKHPRCVIFHINAEPNGLPVHRA